MLKKISYLFIVSVTLFSCTETSESTESENTQEIVVEEAKEENSDKLSEDLHTQLNIIIGNNLLVPISIISDLKDDGKHLYHPEYINSLDNIEKYKDEFSMATNFGVYGVDIIYNIAHNHNEEITDYRDKTLDMATKLGLDSFYVEEDVVAFKEIANDDAKVSEFIFNEYHKIDDYLVSHSRFETMTLMLCGGIIESMYFTGKSIEEFGMSDSKYTLLLNERQTMGQLVDLLDNFKTNEKDQLLKAEMKKVFDAFNSFSSIEEVTEEKIKELDLLVFELRNKIVNNEF